MNNKKFKMKGMGLITLSLLIFFILIVSIFLFFMFFKYHIIVFVSDEYNFNRYQEFSMAFISSRFTSDGIDSPIVFVINNATNGLMGRIEIKTTSYWGTMIKLLPSYCYEISIDNIVYPLPEYLPGEEKTICEKTYTKFTTKYPFPVFTSSNPSLVDLQLIIYSTGAGLWPAPLR